MQLLQKSKGFVTNSFINTKSEAIKGQISLKTYFLGAVIPAWKCSIILSPITRMLSNICNNSKECAYWGIKYTDSSQLHTLHHLRHFSFLLTIQEWISSLMILCRKFTGFRKPSRKCDIWNASFLTRNSDMGGGRRRSLEGLSEIPKAKTPASWLMLSQAPGQTGANPRVLYLIRSKSEKKKNPTCAPCLWS